MSQDKLPLPDGRDGRKKMPKCFCPACGKRVIDTSTKELKNDTRIFLREGGRADLYIECPHCHKILGVFIRALHAQNKMTGEPSRLPAAD